MPSQLRSCPPPHAQRNRQRHAALAGCSSQKFYQSTDAAAACQSIHPYLDAMLHQLRLIRVRLLGCSVGGGALAGLGKSVTCPELILAEYAVQQGFRSWLPGPALLSV